MKLSNIVCVIVFSFLFGTYLKGQLPETEIFMLELGAEDDIEKISFLSNFNKGKYNNQAVFISNNEVLFTAQIDDDQTDIIKLNLRAGTWKRLTKTEESEYSPNLNSDASFTVVRVEKDGKTQTLWEYPLSLENSGNILLQNTGQVGYYQSLPNLKIALFVIEETFNLYLSSLRSDSKNLIEKNIGRCFKISKKGELLYTSKPTDGSKSSIKIFNSINEGITVLAPTIGESEDFCLFGANERLIMAKGASLYEYNNASSTWLLWKDLSSYGIERITRLDSKGNKILLINNKS